MSTSNRLSIPEAMPSLRRQITEIATCSICLEDFKDPRSLPCVHSFCLQCLQGHCKDNLPSDDILCPLCRQKFQIPQDGLQALPLNFFLQNLIEARDIQKKKPGIESCEACSVGQYDEPATVYCVDCSQKLCERCSLPHKNWRGGPHDVRPVGEELSTWLVGKRGSFCNKHTDERLKLYCFHCRGNICTMCFAISHQQHKCDEVEKVAKNFVASIQSDIEPFPLRISQFRDAVRRVEMTNKTLLETLKKMKHEVQRRANEIKSLVDDHATKLIQELNDIKAISVKEAKTRIESYELALTALESFQAYFSETTSKGTPCDITRTANDLHVRATELLKTHVIYRHYRPPNVQFVPANIEDVMIAGGKNNIVGSLDKSQGKCLV